jgi:hypothetical protein
LWEEWVSTLTYQELDDVTKVVAALELLGLARAAAVIRRLMHVVVTDELLLERYRAQALTVADDEEGS